MRSCSEFVFGGTVASFRITPCKLREGWLVPRKGEPPKQVTWTELCELAAPSGSLVAKQNLRKCAAQSAYVLLLRHSTGAVVNAIVRNPDLSGDIRGLLKRDPLFESRMVGAFRFDAVQWDDAMVETATVR